MEKVYCSSCIHFRTDFDNESQWSKYSCTHELNTIVKHTWLKKLLYYDVSPKKLNKHNDCKWHKNSRTAIQKPPRNPSGVDPDPRSRIRKGK